MKKSLLSAAFVSLFPWRLMAPICRRRRAAGIRAAASAVSQLDRILYRRRDRSWLVDPTSTTTCYSPDSRPARRQTIPRFAFDNPESFDFVSVQGGPFIGYNYQIGSQWVVGVEGDWQYADNRRTNAGIPGTEDPTVAGEPGLDSSTVRENWGRKYSRARRFSCHAELAAVWDRWRGVYKRVGDRTLRHSF